MTEGRPGCRQFQKRYEYVTVILDQDKGTVVYVAAGRGRELPAAYSDRSIEDQRAAVKSPTL